MQVIILKSTKEVATYGANIFIKQILKKSNSVLGLATGSTPVALYQQLIAANRERKVSFKSVSTFNLDEYLGLPADHPQSYRYFMNKTLFDHIDIDSRNTAVPPGNARDPIVACSQYESAIRTKGGVDIQLLGIGRNGHVGFNEPSSGLASRTRVKTLTQETIEDNSRFFSSAEYQPHLSITMGIGTILDAKRIVLLATGQSKAKAIRDTIEGPVTASCPASALQLHGNALLIIDEAAASTLADKAFYKHIERENQQLLARLQSREESGEENGEESGGENAELP